MPIYQYDARIRYSEVDSNGFLSPVALLDLFQNCSSFQSEDLHIGVEYLNSIHKAWVLSSWQICMDKMPYFGDQVTIKTWSYDIKYAMGCRNFTLESADGTTLCYANSLWAYIDTKTMQPTRCPKEMGDLYGITPRYEMDYAPRKITLPDTMNEADSFEVKHYFIDTNNHMNNSKYIMAAADYLPNDFNIKEIRAEYKKPAILHDVIHPHIGLLTSTDYIIALKDSNNDTFANIEFITR